MPTAMDEAITRLGVPVTEHTLVRTIIDVLAEFPAPGVRDLPSREFTPAEAATLREAGLDLEPRDFGAADPFLRSRVKYATLVAEGWTAAEVASKTIGGGSGWESSQSMPSAIAGMP